MVTSSTLLAAKLSAEQLITVAVQRAIVKSRMEAIRLISDTAARKQALRQLRNDVVNWAHQNAISLRWLAGAAPRGQLTT